MSSSTHRRRPAAAVTLLLVAASVVEAILATGLPARGSACDPPPPASRPTARPADPLPTDSPLPTGLPTVTPSDTPVPTPSTSQTPNPDECPTGTSVTVSASKTTGVWGTHFHFTGKVICAAAVDPLDVALERRFAGESGWKIFSAHSTNAQFEYMLSDVPSRSADYRVKYLPGQQSLCDPATSSLVRVGVRPGVIFVAKDTTPSVGQTVGLGGKVLPAHAGKRVMLQLLTRDGWRNVATATLDSSSAYAFAYRKTSSGSLLFRVAYSTQDADHLWNISRSLKVTWS